MSHARTLVIDELYNLLSTLGTYSGNVSVSKIVPHTMFPSITIMPESEELIDESLGGNQTRLLNVSVDIRTKHDYNLDDDINDVSAAVENKIATDETLNSKADAIQYVGMEVEYSSEQETPIGLMRMRYAIQYRINKSDVSTVVA